MNMAGSDHNPNPLPPMSFRAKMGSDRQFFARFKTRFSQFEGRFSPFRAPFGPLSVVVMAVPAVQYATPAVVAAERPGV
jgi:hypothetical protein